MKAKATNNKIPTKNIVRLIIGMALILMVPLIAMQFTDEVRWDVKDFIVAGALLLGAGLIYELIAVRISAKYRPMVAAMFIAAVLLVWVELAVGIFE